MFSKRAARAGQHRADPEQAELTDPGVQDGVPPLGPPASGPTDGPDGAGPADPAERAGRHEAADPVPPTALAWSAPMEAPPLASPSQGPVGIDPPDGAPTELVAPVDAPVEIVPVGVARPEPALQATGLGVAADGQWIFQGVELLVRRATVAAVVGPQGSGRSSLLLAVTGRLAVTAGTAAVAGVLAITDAPAVRQLTAVARLGDVVALEASLTVAESVDERCLIDGVRTSAGRVRYAEAARVLGLAVPEYLLVRDLTQEEATLLAVAVACVRPSDLIVLDDLDRGLDAPAQHRVAKALSRLSLVGPAVLVSTVDGWPVKNVVATMITLPPRDRTALIRPVEAVVVVPVAAPASIPPVVDPSSAAAAGAAPESVAPPPPASPDGPIVADPAFAPPEPPVEPPTELLARPELPAGPPTAPVAFPVAASAGTDPATRTPNTGTPNTGTESKDAR
nr:ABC transporter ATP-binding protein [Nakamurella flavida]